MEKGFELSKWTKESQGSYGLINAFQEICPWPGCKMLLQGTDLLPKPKSASTKNDVYIFQELQLF